MRSSSLKRIVDLAGATVLLLPAAPVMLGTAVLIRLSMGRPVLFLQTRAGYRERPFTLIKFRTMRELTGPDGKPLPDARRLTRLGKFLRRTSLDELPQLFNVIGCDMSLIGPRPLLMRYLDRYTPGQARRHEVKPGLTGWAQVNGRNALSWEAKFELDLWYVDHASFWLDAWIVLRTIWNVVYPRGISHASDATMPEFMGTGDGDPVAGSTLPPAHGCRAVGVDPPASSALPGTRDTAGPERKRPGGHATEGRARKCG